MNLSEHKSETPSTTKLKRYTKKKKHQIIMTYDTKTLIFVYCNLFRSGFYFNHLKVRGKGPYDLRNHLRLVVNGQRMSLCHAEAQVDNIHSSKMDHISISMCDN